MKKIALRPVTLRQLVRYLGAVEVSTRLVSASDAASRARARTNRVA